MVKLVDTADLKSKEAQAQDYPLIVMHAKQGQRAQAITRVARHSHECL